MEDSIRFSWPKTPQAVLRLCVTKCIMCGCWAGLRKLPLLSLEKQCWHALPQEGCWTTSFCLAVLGDVLVKSMSLACLSWDFYFLWGTFIFISPLRNRLKLFPSDVVCLFVCVFFETGSHSGAHDGLELTTLLLWPLEHRIAGLCHHGWLCLTLAAWMSDYLERYAGVFLSLYK